MDNPQIVDIDLYRWSTHKMRFNVLKDDGTAWDLTGYTGVLQIRSDYDAALLLELDGASGVQVDASGHVDVTFLGSVFGPLDWTAALYDLFLIDGSGRRYVLANGSIVIDPSVADFS